mmetsp:Transcript_34142/g.89839  ORF Transcript_34142/g.89839 Transcript_34142/m.89839 type:complete len:1198 (-) Transcript_34142:239-3832(-)
MRSEEWGVCSAKCHLQCHLHAQMTTTLHQLTNSPTYQPLVMNIHHSIPFHSITLHSILRPKKGYWNLLDKTWEKKLGRTGNVEANRRLRKEMSVLACPDYRRGKKNQNCIGKAKDPKSELGTLQSECMASVENVTDKCTSVFCSEGSEGRLCARCRRDPSSFQNTYFADNSGTCQKCTGSVTTLVAVLIIALCVALLIIYLAYKFRFVLFQILLPFFSTILDPGKVKVYVSMMQIVGSITWTTGVSWPDPFDTIARTFSLTQLSFVDTVPISCFIKYTFYNELLLSTIGPIVVVIVCLVIKKVMKRHVTTVGSGQGANAPSDKKLKQLVENNKKWRGRTTYLILLLMYFVLPTTSLTITRTFICTKFDDGRSFLNAEYSIECYTPAHSLAMVYAGVMTVVFPLGIPFCFLTLLLHMRGRLCPSASRPEGWRTPGRDGMIKLSDDIKPYRILFGEYRSVRYYAEFFECLRRIMLCCVVAVANWNSAVIRSFVGLVISFFYAIFQGYWMPFENASTNGLAVGVGWQCCFMFFMAFLILSEPFKMDMTVVAIVLTFVTIFLLVLAIFASLKKARRRVEQSVLQQKVKDFQDRVRDIVTVHANITMEDAHVILAKQQAQTLIKQQSLRDLRRQKVKVSQRDGAAEQKDRDDDNQSLQLAKSLPDQGTLLGSVFGGGGGGTGSSGGATNLNLDGGIGIQLSDVKISRKVAPPMKAPRKGSKSFSDDAPLPPSTAIWACMVDGGVEAPYDIELQKELEAKYLIHTSGAGGAFNNRKTHVSFEARGWTYTVDYDTMEQVNERTGARRQMTRTEPDEHDKDEDEDGDSKIRQLKRRGSNMGRRGSTMLANMGQIAQNDTNFMIDLADKIVGSDDTDDTTKKKARKKSAIEKAKEEAANLQPPFPDSLEPRVLLLIKEGQLVQVSRVVTADGVDWCYGMVVSNGEAAEKAAEEALTSESAHTGLDHPDHDEHEINGCELRKNGGWFPAAATAAPTVEEMHYYQERHGGSKAASGALDPPSYWMAAQSLEDHEDMIGAVLYDVPKSDEEYCALEKQFLDTIHGNTHRDVPQTSNAVIVDIKRIENMNLWQSYAAKLNSLNMRAKKENIDTSLYERKYFFHGTNPAVNELIYQQGFNRIFNGKNATFYGKGCYFARDAGYSVAYCAPPNGSKDPHRLFMCRVAVGEYCVGKKDAPVPDVRTILKFYTS